MAASCFSQIILSIWQMSLRRFASAIEQNSPNSAKFGRPAFCVVSFARKCLWRQVLMVEACLFQRLMRVAESCRFSGQFLTSRRHAMSSRRTFRRVRHRNRCLLHNSRFVIRQCFFHKCMFLGKIRARFKKIVLALAKRELWSQAPTY